MKRCLERKETTQKLFYEFMTFSKIPTCVPNGYIHYTLERTRLDFLLAPVPFPILYIFRSLFMVCLLPHIRASWIMQETHRACSSRSQSNDLCNTLALTVPSCLQAWIGPYHNVV